MHRAHVLKDRGNRAFQRGQLHKADRMYEKAFLIAEGPTEVDHEGLVKLGELLVKIHLNKGAVALKLGRPHACVTACQKVRRSDTPCFTACQKVRRSDTPCAVLTPPALPPARRCAVAPLTPTP